MEDKIITITQIYARLYARRVRAAHIQSCDDDEDDDLKLYERLLIFLRRRSYLRSNIQHGELNLYII